MVHLEKDQKVPENELLFVQAPTGDYEDNDLIPCYSSGHPDLAIGAYQAQFIKYGGIVYRFNSPEELGAELVKIDKKSEHKSVQLYLEDQQRKNDREKGKLEPEAVMVVDRNEVIENLDLPQEEPAKSDQPGPEPKAPEPEPKAPEPEPQAPAAEPEAPAPAPEAPAPEPESPAPEPEAPAAENQTPAPAPEAPAPINEGANSSSTPPVIEDSLPAEETADTATSTISTPNDSTDTSSAPDLLVPENSAAESNATTTNQ